MANEIRSIGYRNPLKKVGVVGAGIMGSGIAERFAEAGCEVTVVSRSAATLEQCRQRIEKNQQLLIGAGMLTGVQAAESQQLIHLSTKLEDLSGCQFISENIVEDLQAKQSLFVRLEGIVDSQTVLASDTSGLPITQIQQPCRHPGRVVGMHWWNPPHIIPLIEVIKGERTSEEVARFTFQVCERLGKRPVMVLKDVPGFIGNRIQAAVVREAMWLVENGVATPEDVDVAVQSGFGFRTPVLGPLRANDFAGLDTALRVFGYLFNEIADRTFVPHRLQEMVDAGHLGAKTGKGWYEYPDDFSERVIAERDQQYLKILREILGAFEAARKGSDQ